MPMANIARRWTLEEVEALPEDGNKYELIHGRLFVTSTPTNQHETILARLTRILDPYVAAQGLGYIYHPRAVFRIGREVQVEPDLMVRLPHPGPDQTWETAPLPSLVVEVASRSTRARDKTVKRAVYATEARIPDYWMIDERTRSVRVLRPDGIDVETNGLLEWSPAGASEPLVFDVARLFDEQRTATFKVL
ncbi:MAG TPA: Uma2 family endonuclease [Gemmatimonadaceae bacterium]